MLLESCKRSILFLLVGIFFSFISLNAQSYGNEWVDTSKVHVKIRVGEEAVFRVGYFALETYFADRQQFINTIPLNQLRMYNMGKEVPIFVKDQNNNNKFDVFDFIEFVGHKLDGSFDTELYKKPGDHRHTLQSMVTDSNFYFLTWRSSGTGLRYTPSNVANTGTAPKSWHMSKAKVLENWYYNDGMPILIGSQFTYLPEYTNGEGFVGRDVLANGTDTNSVAATIQLFTPFPYPINTKQSRIETGLTGGSALLANPDALNHKVIFRIGPSTSNVRRIGDTTWANRRAVTIKRNLLGTDIGSPYTYLTFNSTFVNNIPLSIAYHSHSVIEYPRYYNLGDSIRYGYVEDTSSVPVNIEWSNYGNGLASLPVIFDEVNNLRIIGKFDPFTKKMSYTLPPLAQKGQFFIFDESKIIDLFNTDCIGVKMVDYSKLLDVKNQYLMITSSVLNSSPKEEIKEYVNTWSTRYNVSLSLIEDLYNSFSYGIPHPLAVRKFCKYILENSPNNKPQYLLLLGRGYDMRFNRGVENYALVGNYQFNHIPAIGTPVSDNFYTSGLDGTADEPAIPTGRIPANTSDEIGHYLFKLRGYLNTYSTYDPWQKDVLHLSGGGSASQAFIIKGKLKYLEKYPIGDPFAGRVFSYGKSAGGTVDVNFRTTIQNHISNGVSLVSFLGHGSPTVTDIDVGNPDDYNNLNKYPICYFNGCQVGNVCVPLPYNLRGMGEKMFRAQKRGAIAFIGQTTTSELFTVSRQMEYFYKQYFDSVPDKTIGKVIKNSIKNFQIPNSELTRMHCQTLFLSGDPALPIFYPALPDFAVNNTSIFLDPPNAIALQDSFRVGVIISNLGKGVKDSFTVQLGRIYPDISTKRSYSQKVKLTGLVDTVYFVIRSKDKAAAGDNTFNVGLNDEKNPVEYTYDNNYATTKFYMPANGLNLITPSRFAIVGTDSVEMVIQKSDLFKESDDFYVEIDTTPWFNSPLLQSRERDNAPITAGVIAKWKVRLPSLRDTQVYFWRARVNVAGNQGGNWSMRSFTYIKNHREGWMQNVHWQYEPGISSNDYSTLKVDSAENSLVFSKISKKIYIDCNYQKTSNLGIKETGFAGQDLNFGVCIGSGLVVMLWDKRSVSRTYVDPTKLKPSCQWGKAWKAFGYGDDYQLFYAFQMSDPAQRADFVKLINLMPDSTYATIFTRYHSDAQLWDQPVFDALHKIGCTSFDTLTNRTQDAMFVALGKKGWSPGVAREAVVHGGYVQLEAEMIGDADKGYMLSENIGPTNQFNSMIFRPVVTNDKLINESDDFTVDVLGVKADGSYDVIKSKERITNTSLNYIYTGKYRFIRLRANVEDLAGRTAPNLLNWRVTHDSVPEGTLYPEAKYQYEFHSDTLYEGDTFVLKVAFKNISKVKFRDSIKMNWSLSQKITREVLLSDTFKFAALGPDSFFVFKFKYPTLGLNGPYGLQLSVNTDYAQPEKTLVNNSSLINFYVLRDIMRPVLDVTFDGRHLISGDIVSANPVIAITSKDENKFLWQTDTSTFDVFIKKPGASDFTIVKPGTEAVFYPATNKNNQARIEYKPADLPSGTYTLKVQSRDFKQNNAGVQQYEVDFNVIREQSITHFYPYPNPFTSSMRFVFTLTGTSVPDAINVKIMTAEGRVVKELNKDDLGDIHVGNNITQWAWDGTDQYGDKLGNGTYFYKVSVKSGGEEVKLRESKGDGSFKEQVGVIYLMR